MDALVVFGHGEGRPIFQYVTGALKIVGNCVLPVHGEAIGFTNRPIGPGWVHRSQWVQDVRKVVYAPEAIAAALADLGLDKGTIGVAGHPAAFPVDELSELKQRVPGAQFQDATALIDELQIIKSDEELDAIRDTSEMMRRAFAGMEERIVPGMTERAIVAEHTRIIREYGGYDGYCVVSRTPWQTSGMPTDAPLRADETFSIYSEQVGPTGYWCEVSHQYSFGAPAEGVRAMYDLRLEAFLASAAAMRSGNTTEHIQQALDEVYGRHGYDTHGLISYAVHGIGTGPDQPPFVPPYPNAEPLTLQSGMVLSLHPQFNLKGTEPADDPRSGPSDNVLVTPAGGELLTHPQPRWIELPL